MARGTTIQSSAPPPEGDETEVDENLIDGDEGTEGDDGLDFETRARAMGWKPEAQYRGPAGRWMPAREFVERAEREVPIMRDQLRRLQARVASNNASAAEIQQLRAQMAEQQQVLREMNGFVKTSFERGRADMLRELEAKQDAAAAEGNTEQVRAIRQEIRKLENDTVAPPAPKEAPPLPAPPVDPAVTAFIANNPWWDKDKYLTRQMIAAHDRVMAKNPSMNTAAQLQLAKQIVMKENPDRFRDEMVGLTDEEVEEVQLEDGEVEVVEEEPPLPVRQPVRRATVTAPRGAAPQRARQAVDQFTIASIEDPSERAQARATFDRWKRNMPEFTEREYMTTYRDPKADILTVQENIRKARK